MKIIIASLFKEERVMEYKCISFINGNIHKRNYLICVYHKR